VIDISESRLIQLAGARVFGKGLALYERGGVQSSSTDGNRTQAVVQDREAHTVVLRHTPRVLEGECDCEASGGVDFCVHCVAAALALQDRLSTSKSVSKRAAMTAIRGYLSSLSHGALLDEFLEVLGQDRDLRDELYQQSRFASGGVSYPELKGMIERIDLDGEPWERPKVRACFQRFTSLLQRLQAATGSLEPLILLRTSEFAIDRFDGLTQVTDEYFDAPETLSELLGELHRRALRGVDWPATALAGYLMDRYLADSWHPIQGDADLYVIELGASVTDALIVEIDERLGRSDPASETDTVATGWDRVALETLKSNLQALLAEET